MPTPRLLKYTLPKSNMEPENRINRPGPNRLQKHQFPGAKIVRFREGIGQLHPLRPQLLVSLTRKLGN